MYFFGRLVIVTSRSRISLLLQETEGEAWGSSVNNNDILCVLVIYNCLMCFDYKQIIRDFCLLLKINTLKLFIDLLDGLEIQKKLPTLMTF